MDPKTAITSPHLSWHMPRHAAFNFAAYNAGRQLDHADWMRCYRNEPETRTPRHSAAHRSVTS